MTTTKSPLGRGLSELLSTIPSVSHLADTVTPVVAKQERHTLPIDLLQPGRYQPRQEFDSEALEELADSIRAQGILQPLLVRPLSQGRYEIIAGERRWRAAQLASLQEVPVFIRDIPDEAAMAMGLIENIQREDLNAIEQAVALQRLGEEFNMTHEAIALAVGKSRATVTNLLRLLQLAMPVKALLEHRQLEMGHARALLSLPDHEQVRVANLVVERGLSVRETERLVQQPVGQTTAKRTRQVDPDILHLEKELADKLGAAVTIEHKGSKGKLVIQYYSLEELEGVLQRIR